MTHLSKSWTRLLGWSAAPAIVLSAMATATAPGCGADCVIITTGTRQQYTVDFFVETAGRFGALQGEVSSDDCNGEWNGDGDRVECETLVDAISATNSVGRGVLRWGMISLEGVRTPSAVLRCVYSSFEEPQPSDFRITVLDASDTESKPLAETPTIVVANISPR